MPIFLKQTIKRKMGLQDKKSESNQTTMLTFLLQELLTSFFLTRSRNVIIFKEWQHDTAESNLMSKLQFSAVTLRIVLIFLFTFVACVHKQWI